MFKCLAIEDEISNPQSEEDWEKWAQQSANKFQQKYYKVKHRDPQQPPSWLNQGQLRALKIDKSRILKILSPVKIKKEKEPVNLSLDDRLVRDFFKDQKKKGD